MAIRCTIWRESSHHTSSGALVSKCGRDVELQVRPLSLTRTSSTDPYGFVVRYKGSVVRHGQTRGREAAKKAARRQAGATGGLNGILDFFKAKPKKKAKERVGSRLVYVRPSPSGSLRGTRKRRRR